MAALRSFIAGLSFHGWTGTDSTRAKHVQREIQPHDPLPAATDPLATLPGIAPSKTTNSPSVYISFALVGGAAGGGGLEEDYA